MHSLKRVAQPQAHSKPKWERPEGKKYPSEISHCPLCNRLKGVHSELCRQCRVDSRRTPVSSNVFYIEGEPCRWVALTQNQAAIVDEALHEELSKWNWFALGNPVSGFYARRRDNIALHRQIMGFPSTWIDHKNRDTLDCRRSNLRTCTRTQNRANSRRQGGKYSRHKGVSWEERKHRWRARICIQGKNIHLGYHRQPEDAARAYDAAAIRYFGEFAHPNFPTNHPPNQTQASLPL
jgi:hypothetical protein